MSNDSNLLPDALLPDVYRDKAMATTKRYHVGMAPGGPAWNITLAGIAFPITTSSYDDNDNETRREGAFVHLNSKQCKEIREAIANRIVRWSHYPKWHKRAGERMSAQVFDVRIRGFEPERTDEPLVKYLYFKEAPPEFTAPPPPASAFVELDRAIKEAEAVEASKVQDPEDTKLRKQHGALKAAGSKLPADGQL
jgi:hypothetical protein